MRLSQAQLNLLETCPRKFQHTYLEQLNSPISPEQQAGLTWGSQFHLLMQQRELGLPIEPILATDEQLRQWFMAFVSVVPELQPDRVAAGFRQSEHQRSLEFSGHLLTVIYDLILLNTDQAEILDWKTYPKPTQSQSLAKNWQTRLYRFVLAETSDYLPEQIAMTYWFVQSRSPTGEANPQCLRFAYSQEQHEQTRRDLTQLFNHLDRWLAAYPRQEFPQVPETSRECDRCHFALRCQRQQTDEASWFSGDRLPTLAEIEEVAI